MIAKSAFALPGRPSLSTSGMREMSEMVGFRLFRNSSVSLQAAILLKIALLVVGLLRTQAASTSCWQSLTLVGAGNILMDPPSSTAAAYNISVNGDYEYDAAAGTWTQKEGVCMIEGCFPCDCPNAECAKWILKCNGFRQGIQDPFMYAQHTHGKVNVPPAGKLESSEDHPDWILQGKRPAPEVRNFNSSRPSCGCTICKNGVLNRTIVAGYVCLSASGSQLGDSNTNNYTQEACSAASGTWTPYTCGSVQNHWFNNLGPGDQCDAYSNFWNNVAPLSGSPSPVTCCAASTLATIKATTTTSRDVFGHEPASSTSSHLNRVDNTGTMGCTICKNGVLNRTIVAGYVCLSASGSPLGDSNTNNYTQQACSAASGTWTSYTCGSVQDHWFNNLGPGDQCDAYSNFWNNVAPLSGSPSPVTCCAAYSAPHGWGSTAYAHCYQPFSWKQLKETSKDDFKAGGLGKLTQPNGYNLWVCLHNRVTSSHVHCGDPFFCWLYHETHEVFTPWGPNSVVRAVNSAATRFKPRECKRCTDPTHNCKCSMRKGASGVCGSSPYCYDAATTATCNRTAREQCAADSDIWCGSTDPVTCSSWMGTCPVDKQKRVDGDNYTCPNGICTEEACCIKMCSSWMGKCPAGQYKRDDYHPCSTCNFECCQDGAICSHWETPICSSWNGACPAGKHKREAHDMHVCKDNICNEAECCLTECSDWPGVCPTGEYKNPLNHDCGDKHFTVSVTNNDAIVTKAAADVVEAGDVLSIYDVDYSVMSITSPTTIVLTTPYAGETIAAVPAWEVKLRNKCNADECCRAGAFCSEWSAP